MQQTNFGTFPRPMLNSPIEHPDYSGEVFVAKKMARLNASREANKIMIDCVYNQALPRSTEIYFADWFRLMRIWQSLQNRYGVA